MANSADINREMILQKDAKSPGLGSTDMGNISQVFPSIHPMLSIDAKNAVNHQPEYAAATITLGVVTKQYMTVLMQWVQQLLI